jgi:hypothetical protein
VLCRSSHTLLTGNTVQVGISCLLALTTKRQVSGTTDIQGTLLLNRQLLPESTQIINTRITTGKLIMAGGEIMINTRKMRYTGEAMV